MADFQRLRLRQRKHLLIVFDLLELDGKDLRREPIEVRKATLASVYSDFRLGAGQVSQKNVKILEFLIINPERNIKPCFRSGAVKKQVLLRSKRVPEDNLACVS